MGAFGMGCKSSLSSYEFPVKQPKPENPNPDPFNYKVIRAEFLNELVILEVKYPDCTTFEGRKLMVYENVKPEDFINTDRLDPHFFEGYGIKSPIARFKPSKDGWAMAHVFCLAWQQHKQDSLKTRICS